MEIVEGKVEGVVDVEGEGGRRYSLEPVEEEGRGELEEVDLEEAELE